MYTHRRDSLYGLRDLLEGSAGSHYFRFGCSTPLAQVSLLHHLPSHTQCQRLTNCSSAFGPRFIPLFNCLDLLLMLAELACESGFANSSSIEGKLMASSQSNSSWDCRCCTALSIY
jgi:hypothetical protein